MQNSPVPPELQKKIERYKKELEAKHGKSLDQLHAERKKRFYDAVLLRTPDRIPVGMQTGAFPAGIKAYRFRPCITTSLPTGRPA